MRAILSILFVFALVAQSFAQQTENTATPVPATSEVTVATSKTDKKATKEQELTEEQLNQQLFTAIAAGDLDEVKPLLNAMTYYKQNEEGETALTLAINKEDIPMVRHFFLAFNSAVEAEIFCFAHNHFYLLLTMISTVKETRKTQHYTTRVMMKTVFTTLMQKSKMRMMTRIVFTSLMIYQTPRTHLLNTFLISNSWILDAHGEKELNNE